MITLQDIFPNRLSFTDIVSYATDEFGCVEQKQFTLQQDVSCGDVITEQGALFAEGDTTAFIVISDFVPAGDQFANVLRAPNVGSLVCIKSDNLNAVDKTAAITFLKSQGFQTQEFYTS